MFLSNGPNISLPNWYAKRINIYLDASDLICLFKILFTLLYSVISYYTLIYSVHWTEVPSWKLFSLTSLCFRFVKYAQMYGLLGTDLSAQSGAERRPSRPIVFTLRRSQTICLESVPGRSRLSTTMGGCRFQPDPPLSSHRCCPHPDPHKSSQTHEGKG